MSPNTLLATELRARQQATEFMQDHPSYPLVTYYRRKGEPLEFSRHVCKYVAQYVGNKIRQFEHEHGIEAPPHLTAIHSLAKAMAAQHPPKPTKRTWPHQRPCADCGNTYTAKGPYHLRCRHCAHTHNAQQRRLYKQTPQYKEQKRRYEQSERGKQLKQLRGKPKPRKPDHPCHATDCDTIIPGNRKWCDTCRTARNKQAQREWKQRKAQQTAQRSSA